MKEDKKKFIRLRDIWLEETSCMSSMTDIVNNNAYQEIILMGDSVLTYIFEDLQDSPKFWFQALRMITGTQPYIPESSVGKVSEISYIWLAWGKENNYI